MPGAGEQLANAGGNVKPGYSQGGVHAGIGLGFGVLKATDRETYTKALTEAREWVEEHHAGAVMGMVRATVLVNEMVEVTAGTAGKAVGAMSKIGIAAFIPKGTTLKMLEEMAEAGEAISKSGKIAMKLGKVMEFAEKFDGIISMFNVVGGVAKFITAETKTDRVDSVVKVGTGLASLGAKALGEAAGAAPLAAGAFAVGATWEMTKFFGEMGLDAIEGSLYGGLYQELSEIEPKVDDVARAYLVTDRAMQEHNARFKDANVTDAKAAGAAEAIDDLAYSLQKKLRTAAVRWQNSAIPALYRNFKYGSTSSGEQLQARVANALGFDMSSGGSDSYEATEIADTAKDLVTEFRKEWHNAPFTVLQMAVDQGYMSPDRASEMGAKLAKKAHKE